MKLFPKPKRILRFSYQSDWIPIYASPENADDLKTSYYTVLENMIAFDLHKKHILPGGRFTRLQTTHKI